jgi:hypothetical protein
MMEQEFRPAPNATQIQSNINYIILIHEYIYTSKKVAANAIKRGAFSPKKLGS